MKGLKYLRQYCTFDFILFTDDEVLLDSYKKMYGIQSIALEYDIEYSGESYVTGTAAKFFLLHKKLERENGKKFCSALYIKEQCRVIYVLPDAEAPGEEQTIDLEPLQILENLMYRTLTPKDGILALHGGAVAKNGRTVLVSAGTTTGKSTLTAFMRLKGYEYITDDEIFICQKTVCVEPETKTMSMRQGGYEMLRRVFENDKAALSKLDNAAHILRSGADYYLLPPEKTPEHGRYEIAGIVFLEGYGSNEPYMRKISAAEAFMKLLKGQLSGQKLNKDVNDKYKVLTELAKKAYAMRYSDLQTAEQYLKQLLN